jgi:hypothetical protein
LVLNGSDCVLLQLLLGSERLQSGGNDVSGVGGGSVDCRGTPSAAQRDREPATQQPQSCCISPMCEGVESWAGTRFGCFLEDLSWAEFVIITELLFKNYSITRTQSTHFHLEIGTNIQYPNSKKIKCTDSVMLIQAGPVKQSKECDHRITVSTDVSKAVQRIKIIKSIQKYGSNVCF